MDFEGDRRAPNPWTLPALALGAGILLASLFPGSWLRALTLPFALLGLALSLAAVRHAHRTGGRRTAPWLAVPLTLTASLTCLAALGDVLSSYDGL
ncbi:hypothetical protein ACIQBJ_03735 [Kitasatospora sp. NPDC088391]|uniref:hypothetical protein n=1 Tax=Kitasatospora sp. NPDC088391 TaxID=3364074 RepID=UPI003830CF93